MTKQIVILDSTQIDTYCTCPSQWLYGFHESLELRDAEDKEAIAMGTLGHKWLELYYSAKALGHKQAECIAAANTLNPDELSEDAQFPLAADKRKIVIDRCQQYWMTYSQNDFTPSIKCEYAITFDSNGLPVDGFNRIPLVEQGFSYELFNSPEYLFILEGRIDVIASMGNSNGIGFVDHKFQLRERNLYNKSIQFKNYSLATGLNFGIINYIRLHKEVSNKTFKRDIIAFNSGEIKAWRGELIDIYIDVAKKMKGDHNWSFPRNRAACSGKFGYPCQFTHICEEPNRQLGNAIKNQMYKIKKEWKPW